MKLSDLVEVASTGSMEQHGIDFDQFTDRQLFCQENGKQIYRSVADNGQLMFDIDQQAFVVGDFGDNFKGQIKNKIFVTRRGWCDPSVRGTGLITTIMMGLFRQKDIAIMSDSVFSSDGKATWLKLCNVLPITHYYVVVRGEVREITRDIMLDQIEGTDDDSQYIIESFFVDGMVSGMFESRLLKGGGMFERYDFNGLV